MVFEIRDGMQSVAANSYWTIQPTAGETWVVTRVGSSAFDDFRACLYNGANRAVMTRQGATATGEVKMLVDNTNYFQLYNDVDAANADMGYCAILL
jgi:hypothetical protein